MSKGSSIGLGVTWSEQTACSFSCCSWILRLAAWCCWLVDVGVIGCWWWWLLLVVTDVLRTGLQQDEAFMSNVPILAILASKFTCSSSNLVLLAVTVTKYLETMLPLVTREGTEGCPALCIHLLLLVVDLAFGVTFGIIHIVSTRMALGTNIDRESLMSKLVQPLQQTRVHLLYNSNTCWPAKHN